MRRAIVCVAICTTLGCGTASPSSSRDGGSGGDAPSVIPANPCAGIERWNSLGDSLRGGSRLGDHVAAAANPAGGVLVAGNLRIARTDSTEHVATMFTGGGEPFDVKWGPKPLASGGEVFGAGVDSL